jgi:signal peptidase I
VLEHQVKAVKRVKKRGDSALRPLQRRINTWLYGLRKFLTSELPRDVPYRFPWVAGALALIPSGGQLYNRQYKKAVLLVLGYAAIMAAVVVTIRERYSNVVVAGWILYAIYCYKDAVVSAARINGQHWTLRKSLAMLSYLVFMLGIILLVMQFFMSPVFKLVYVSQDVLRPALRKGDRLFVDCVSYWFREPRRGEVIYYDPERYEIEIPGTFEGTRYVINERRSFERISGVGGDVVENREGELYLNGKPMAEEYKPLKLSELPRNFRFEVPEGRYLAIISHSSTEGGLLGGTSPALDAGKILKGWDKASIIKKGQIIGRVLLIYYPPGHRRFMTVSEGESE